MAYTETFVDSTGQTHTLKPRFHRQSRMRYRAENLEELFADDFKLLKQYINHHQTVQRPRIQELFDYAEGNNHTILESERRKDQDMADTRAVHNFGEYIATFKQGYLVGNPIQVSYDDTGNESVIRFLDEISKNNSFHQLNRSLVLDLSKTGRAYDLVYRTQEDETKAVKLDPTSTFVIYDMTKEENSLVGVRYYDKNQFSNNQKIIEVYTPDKILIIDSSEDFKIIDEAPHFFGTVPLTEYLNSSNGMGDYESVLTLIDLYDSSQSDTANYMQDLSDAILAIIGRVSFPSDCDTAEKQIEFMRKMRKARLLNLEPPVDANGNEGSVDAKYLYKQYDVNGTEAYKNRVIDDIHKITNTPDLSDDNFSGTQSGEAMKWKIFGFDQKRVDMQALFEKSLKRRYKLIARISETLREIQNFDLSKVRVTFVPNLPADTSSVVANAKSLYGVVSDETVYSMLQSATGVDAKMEMERIEKQQQNSSLLSIQLEKNSRLSDKNLNEEDENNGEQVLEEKD